MIRKAIQLGALSLVTAAVAGAQTARTWNPHVLGVAQVDTKGTIYGLGGLSASMSGLGLTPIVGVQVSDLNMNPTGGRQNVFGVKPYVGLGYALSGGELSGDVGYLWSNKTGNFPFTGTGGSVSKGTVLSGAWDYWGTGGPWGHQLLGSYNFGGKDFWGRAQVTKRYWQDGAAQRRFGVEVAALHGNGYSGYQPGVIWQMHNGKGFILVLGAGAEIYKKSSDNAGYFKIEAYAPIGR
jgi:hypothetical protein